jgi:hypothetical protein
MASDEKHVKQFSRSAGGFPLARDSKALDRLLSVPAEASHQMLYSQLET